jgi:carbonic anhydrase
MIAKLSLLLAAPALVYSSASPPPAASAAAPPPKTFEEIAHEKGFPHHWSYDGSGAAHFWDDISAGNAKCELGKKQSPINLGDSETFDFIKSKDDDEVVLTWPSANNRPGLVFKNLGHTVQVGPFPGLEPGNQVPFVTRYIDENFHMLQFHFHTPSEHHVLGDFSPMEVHFVHKSDSGKLAVLGIMMELSNTDANNTFMNQFNNLINKIPNNGDSVPVTTLNVNLAKSTTNDFANGFYTYAGSLTTPPCLEGVNWIVAKDRMQISAAQWNQFKNLIKYSARQTQRRMWSVEEEYIIDHADDVHSAAAPKSGMWAAAVAVFPLLAQLFV